QALDTVRRRDPLSRSFGTRYREGVQGNTSHNRGRRALGREANRNPVIVSGSAPGDQALTIAQADALDTYGDLAPYRIHLVLEEDGWHVDYELKDPRLKGGGPHYLIDPYTGVIRSKQYHQ